LIDTILFDLDGTLCRFTQEDFINTYFKEIGKVFFKLGLDPEDSIKAVWAGTKAMVLNDGTKLNTQRFWAAFSDFMDLEDEQLKAVEEACDSFYTNEFNVVKSIVTHSEISDRLVREMASRGYRIILATNPLFPPCAVDTRLGWIGLSRNDFELITHYENSSFCKPNPSYFREILSKIGKSPEQCIMVGNNPAEDMIAEEVGMDVFLVTDFMENEAGIDISKFRQGTLEDLEAYLYSLPAL